MYEGNFQPSIPPYVALMFLRKDKFNKLKPTFKQILLQCVKTRHAELVFKYYSNLVTLSMQILVWTNLGQQVTFAFMSVNCLKCL